MIGRHDDELETELSVAPGARVATRRHPFLSWRDSDGAHETTVDRPTLVGSASKADLVIVDTTVSRLHAELEPREDGLWVRDLGSRNGTFVEGVRVTEARVPDGGKIRVGATIITVNASVETSVELWVDDHFGPLVGGSVVMRELFATLARVAPLDSTVLVEGETGTGKELVARAIHDASSRAQKPFVTVDCAALPEQLFEAELFGHARGAFTGAAGARAGALEAAEGGTVFLDEIGELPLAMQPKLLRALESRSVRRLGETAHRHIDVRFVSATHRDLRSMVNAGAFREDLYFRIAVLPVHLPPLRKRMEDVTLLVDRFHPNASRDWKAALLAEAFDRPWLGNVRELRNFVERAVAFGTKQALAMSDGRGTQEEPRSDASPFGGWSAAFEKPFRDFKDEVEREYIRRLLERHGGNVTAAAQAAEVDRTYVYRLLRKYEG